jgi:hypothetical protein
MTDVLSVNSTVSETLGEYDDYYNGTNGHYYDVYQLTNLAPGYGVTIDLASNNFDTVVGIYNASSGQLVGSSDDGGAGTNSSFTFTPTFGDQSAYYAIVTSYGPNSTGNYQISAHYS